MIGPKTALRWMELAKKYIDTPLKNLRVIPFDYCVLCIILISVLYHSINQEEHCTET